MFRIHPIVASMVTTVAVCTMTVTANAQSKTRVEAGVLNCRVAGGTGFIVGSTKTLSCTFQRQGGKERYRGKISKFGIDIGQTTQSNIAWAVLAPTVNVRSGALDGNYAGVSGEATLGVGLGANALVGGSSNTIALQPLSVQSQQGLNIAAGIASLELRWQR